MWHRTIINSEISQGCKFDIVLHFFYKTYTLRMIIRHRLLLHILKSFEKTSIQQLALESVFCNWFLAISVWGRFGLWPLWPATLVNTWRREINVHGWYFLASINLCQFAPARTIDEYDVTIPVLPLCVTSQVNVNPWWHHNARLESTVLGDNVEMSDRQLLSSRPYRV